MFWRKGCRWGNCWSNELLHCALINVHLVLEYNIIYFVFDKRFNISGNCFISAAIIFPKISSADNSPVLFATDFSSFSYINLDMSVITSISVSLMLDGLNFFILCCWLPFSERGFFFPSFDTRFNFCLGKFFCSSSILDIESSSFSSWSSPKSEL